jgi:hypothetical protein
MMQKNMLEGELSQMRQDMKQYLESMKEGMYQMNGQFGYGQQLQQQQMMQYSNPMFAPLSSTNAQPQIASIANVFYNMLNLLGEKE